MPRPIPKTAFDLLRRLAGVVEERSGKDHHPLIVWGFELCSLGRNTPDEWPWCSAILQVPTFLLDVPRSKNAAARSWLEVGLSIDIVDAEAGWDVVVLKRGQGEQPGPEVTRGAPGHVGLFDRLEADGRTVHILAGNQSDSLSIAPFPVHQVLGVRRLVT